MPRHYEDNETRRRQVAEATLQTIAEDGVAGFTTRAVATRVGISDGTLFRHFGSKQDIVLEAMDLLEAGIRDGLVSTGDASGDLEAFFRHRASFVGAQGSVGRLIFSDELLHLAGAEGHQRVERWRSLSVGYLLERLGVLKTTGRLRADLDIPATWERRLRWFVITPDWHRVHHSVHRVETDSNYGNLLSLWDRLFRSMVAQPRDGHRSMSIGLDEFREERSQRLAALLVLPILPDRHTSRR